MANNHFKIPYINLESQWKEDCEDILPIVESVLRSGHYVGGDEVDKFEKNIAEFCEVEYAISLNSGTDALTLALHLLDIGRGDEVITTPNSFIATTAVIVHLGAKPVFVDVLPDQNIDPDKIEGAITNRTKAILPVHLTGRICKMEQIIEVAERHDLVIVEDAAQAIGSRYNNYPSGSIGSVGCFSTHPLKNLNACGDGGFMVTNEEKLYYRAKELQNHGMKERNIVNEFGYVSRMDNIQAAILNYRLRKLDKTILKRRLSAKAYFDGIHKDYVFIPKEKKEEFNTYHTFVIQAENRNELKSYLMKKGIETAIHYETPIHLQPAAKKLGYKKGDFPETEKQAERILTLPVNQSLSKDQVQSIISLINDFYH